VLTHVLQLSHFLCWLVFIIPHTLAYRTCSALPVPLTPIERLYCKRPIRCLASSGGEGVGGSIFWKTPDTALYSTYVSTLWCERTYSAHSCYLGYPTVHLYSEMAAEPPFIEVHCTMCTSHMLSLLQCKCLFHNFFSLHI